VSDDRDQIDRHELFERGCYSVEHGREVAPRVGRSIGASRLLSSIRRCNRPSRCGFATTSGAAAFAPFLRRACVRHETCDTASREGAAIADAVEANRNDGQVRISGALTGNAIGIVLDAVANGVTVFDLSEVDRADDRGVRALAGLSPERCSFEGCPPWLALWLERVRGGTAHDDGRAGS